VPQLSADPGSDDVPVPSFGPRTVCTRCGIVGADAKAATQRSPTSTIIAHVIGIELAAVCLLANAASWVAAESVRRHQASQVPPTVQRMSGAASAPYWRSLSRAPIRATRPAPKPPRSARAGIVSRLRRHDRYGFDSR
jgi:hypothetical protein